MLFVKKRLRWHYDGAGIPMLDYHGTIGLQYNPIAIAQWGLANYNLFCEAGDTNRWQKCLRAADWLAANQEQNAHGLWVWNHHFDWDYRDTLKSPWYSGLAQGQVFHFCCGHTLMAWTRDISAPPNRRLSR